MIAPLAKLFKALGMKGYEDLKPPERASYERWEKMLRAEVNIEDLKKYLGTELERLRNLREDETATPGDRVDTERLAEVRTIKGMLGQYAKAENLKKQAEAEIDQSIKNISSNKE